MFLKSLAAIGFAVDAHLTAADLIALLSANATETIETKSGSYRICRLETGAEVSLHMGRAGTPQAGRIVGLTPFHVGEGGVRICILSTLPLDVADPLAAAYSAALPALKRGDRPLQLVIELTPYISERAAPSFALVEVQLLALAEEVVGYASSTDFLYNVPKDCLVSPGALAPLAASDRRPTTFAGNMRCQALVTGRVRDATPLVNPLTGQAYWWLHLETDRGPVFLAVNRRAFTGAPPVPGAIVQARARLVCRHRGPVTVLRGAVPEFSDRSASQQAADESSGRAWPPGAFEALDDMGVLPNVEAIAAMLPPSRAPADPTSHGGCRGPHHGSIPGGGRSGGEFDHNPGLNVPVRARK